MSDQSAQEIWPQRPNARRTTTGIGSKREGRRFFSQKLGWRRFLKGITYGIGGLGALKGYEITKKALDVVSGDDKKEAVQVLNNSDQAQNENVLAGPVGETKENQIFENVSNFHLVFHDLTPQQLEEAGDKVSVMEGVVSARWRDKNVKRYEAQIVKSAKDANIPKGLFLGLIYIESGGDEHNVSHAGAKGLTQVMDSMAQEWQGKGFNFTNREDDDRFKPNVVLAFSASEIRGLYERYGDWGIAFWAWHAGPGNVYDGLQIHFRESMNLLLPSVGELSGQEAYDAVKRYKETTITNKISVHHVLSDPSVAKHFSGWDWDYTTEYVYRIVAGEKIYQANSDMVPDGLSE